MGSNESKAESSVGLRSSSTGSRRNSGNTRTSSKTGTRRSSAKTTKAKAGKTTTKTKNVVEKDENSGVITQINSTRPPEDDLDLQANDNGNEKMLTSQQEVADFLGFSTKTLMRYLEKYPFDINGTNGKAGGRWRVPQSYVLKWWEYVLRQERRHPEMRRTRPEAAPKLEG